MSRDLCWLDEMSLSLTLYVSSIQYKPWFAICQNRDVQGLGLKAHSYVSPSKALWVSQGATILKYTVDATILKMRLILKQHPAFSIVKYATDVTVFLENDKRQNENVQKCSSDQPQIFITSSKSIFHLILRIQHVTVMKMVLWALTWTLWRGRSR